MTVLIKGLKMPEKEYVDIRIFSNGTATTATGTPPYFKELDVTEVPVPHGRLIDAIDALTNTMYQNVKKGATYPKKEWFDGMANASEIIGALPSAEPKHGKWIPVAEKLPQYGNYLVSFKTDVETDIGTFNPETGLWSACDADGFYYVASRGLEVVAWMPLPTPYEEES